MKIQLWSYNYEPEPAGIGPLSRTLARALAERGHQVEVVAAHPHYPEPRWGTRVRPYRERRDGIRITRFPIWPGRASAIERIRQELSFVAPLSAALPLLDRPDVLVAVSPSFPALAPAMAFSSLRRVPWLLWLQDILPDGAMATGVLSEGPLIEAARRFEQMAYRSAGRIVVISDSFRENLLAKGVPEAQIARVYNPASRPVLEAPRPAQGVDPGLVLNMGNIGHTQNLVAVTEAFENDPDLERLGARFVMAGDGVAGGDVRGAVRSDRVEVTGVLTDPAALEPLLMSAAVGLVTQSYEGIDFNVPSKLANFMGYGLPVVAAVRPDSEVARLVGGAGAGWVTTSPQECAATLAKVLPDAAERERRGVAGLAFAQRELSPQRLADQFEQILERVLSERRR